MHKPKFSVVLIARNESKTLPRLVGSLKEFQERGGEIVLLDTGSTDGTAQIARDLGCQVQEVGEKFLITVDEKMAKRMNEKFSANEGELVKAGAKIFDYSSARNYIANFSSNDMIATPDCDEIFTRFDIDAINAAIDGGVDQLEYNFVFSHDNEGNEMIKFMHSKFYNRMKLVWVGVIHEVLQTIDPNTSVNRRFLDESMIKLEHWQNPETNRSHYLTGLLYDCYMNPDNDRNAHYLGRELMYAGKLNSAMRQLERHVDMKKWPTEASQSMIFIGDCQFHLGNREEAIASYAKAFDMEPGRREPLMKLAELYWKEGKPDQAVAYASAALQIKAGNFYANYAPYYEYLPHEILYWGLWQREEVFASKDHFDICMAYQPFNPKYLHDFRFYYNLPEMSFVIPTLGRPEGLKKCIESIKNLNYPQDKIEIIVVHDGESLPTDILEDGVVRMSSPEGQGVPKALKAGVEKATGDWIVYASNDIEFTPDSLMIAFKTAMDNKKFFMSFNTGEVSPDEGNICEHFMIHRKLVSNLNGEIFDTDFNHVGVDNLLWAKMKKIRQAMRCDRAIVHHNHFSQTGVMDEVTMKAWNEESVKKDRDLLETKLLELSNADPLKEFQG